MGGRRVFNSQAQRTEGGSGVAFVTPEQYQQHDQKVKAAEERSRRMGSRWRRESEAFRSACRRDLASQVKGRSADIRADDSMVACSHCGRRFEPSVAERHVPMCASVAMKEQTHRFLTQVHRRLQDEASGGVEAGVECAPAPSESPPRRSVSPTLTPDIASACEQTVVNVRMKDADNANTSRESKPSKIQETFGKTLPTQKENA